MKLLPHILGILAAFATGGLLLAYLFVGEGIRPWVLYFTVCALGITVAALGLLAAGALNAIFEHPERLEQQRADRGNP